MSGRNGSLGLIVIPASAGISLGLGDPRLCGKGDVDALCVGCVLCTHRHVRWVRASTHPTAASGVLVFRPEVVPVFQRLLNRECCDSGCGPSLIRCDRVHRIVGRLIWWVRAASFGSDLVQCSHATALGDGKARIGIHLGRRHLAFGGHHVLDELLDDRRLCPEPLPMQ